MKKVLFATTAMVAFASAAAAEVAISGSAEMGINGGDGVDTQFFQDIDVTFKLSGATDNGLTFGAAVDLDEAQDDCEADAGDAVDCVNAALDNTADDGGVAIFVSGAFGTLTLGDTDGALDWALTEAGNVANPGSIADDETSHAGYQGSYLDGVNGGDGQILQYNNTFGALGVAVSVEQNGNGAGDTGYAIGAKYALDLGGTTVNLGAGYQQASAATGLTAASATGLSATVGFGAATVGVVYTSFDDYSRKETLATDSHLGLGIGYEMDAISLHANYGSWDGATDATGFGLAAGYDLGGASILLGYGSEEVGTAAAVATWSLGVSMSF